LRRPTAAARAAARRARTDTHRQALNLYRAPDDLLRVHDVFKRIQRSIGLDKPIWLTETNAMPTDDRQIRCNHADDAIKTTLDEQASFAIQALALATAAGYRRIGFYQMVDDDPCRQPGVWGVVRADGSRRPVADALKTAMTLFNGVREAQFVPLARSTERWPAWPGEPTSYVPNWEIYQVVLELPDNKRATVVWNGDARPACVEVRRSGRTARVLDRSGSPSAAVERAGSWRLTLGPATAHAAVDPDGYYFIGGPPLILVEDGVFLRSPPVAPTRCGDL
jgi:hypothetical protein